MKTRHFSFLSLATAYVLLTSASGIVVGGCGGGGGGTGTGGTGGGTVDNIVVDPGDLVSDFEDLAAATVVMAGTPARNGYWYTYNDDNPKGTDATCVQVPPSGPQLLPNPPATYVGEAPPSAPPATMGAAAAGAMSLHAKWAGCSVWGAGIGADLGQPQVDGGTYTGPKVPYDISAFKGVTFLAMAVTGSDTALRIKLPMTDETKIEDGGLCTESATTKCSDDFGAKFNLPSNGTWKRITVRWTDATFIQEGWGAIFTWNPAHVTSIQIQSQNKVESYDFFIDDMYFIK